MRGYKPKKYSINVKFGANVQKYRRKRHISQEKLAEIIGVHRNHVGRIERGETNPPLYLVYKITKALKVESSDLLTF